MSPKDFLLQECENVKDLLDKTLRHDYGADSSRDFFDECSTRLSFLTAQIKTTDEANTSLMESWSRFLNNLAALICRIERSSLGEYSWPFVEELKKIASAICCESTLQDPNSPPNIYVFAEGGLASYAIYTEHHRPSASQRRLLTIVFPKSLKNFVLLHPILGHELGHAIWQVSKHQKALNQNVIPHLFRVGGCLEKPASTAAHLYSKSAPQEVRDNLAKLPVTEANIFEKLNWGAWIEEILCDLIGLVTFGPGFVAAHCRLLYSIDPSGTRLTPDHPLVAWRVNMVIAGAKLLAFDQLPPKESPLRISAERFWQYLEGFKRVDPWYDFLATAQLQDALQGIKQLLDAHPPSSYQPPSSDRLEMLVNKLIDIQPPIGNEIGEDYLPKSESIDFRHIIYAGWIAETDDKKIPFKRINQLCEHAIMQQRAIEISLTEPKT